MTSTNAPTPSVTAKPGEINANIPKPNVENKEISVKNPDPNAPKIAAGLSTLSSVADPIPHYFMAAFSK